MKKNYLLLLVALVCSIVSVQAQNTDIKYYPKTSKAGEVSLLYSYGEYRDGISSKLYVIDVPRAGSYYLYSLANMELAQSFKVYVDKREFEKLPAEAKGWQLAAVKDVPVQLSAGMHEIRFEGLNAMVPMVDEIYLSAAGSTERVPEAAIAFIDKVNQLKQQPVMLPGADEPGGFLNKVLPNPEGLYNHAIDTAFTYTHYSTIYLTPGNHSFATSGSTISRSLTIFHTTSFSYSWANVNGGPGGESLINIAVASSGYYAIMLRPTVNGTTGTTTILHNGNTMVSGAIIGGKTYSMSSLKGGPLNFFTCKLTAGDTRMIASRYTSSSARGYNDDYGSSGGGDFSWGVASRINKDFTGDSVQYGFVCAYSPTSTGICDIYLGNENSNVYEDNYSEFPLLKADDAIKSASSTGYYNCISWSGGITSDWIWPPSLFSTYNCSNSQNDITCFDNFYGNSPVRYPGAWNYTRTGATSGNSVVDLWKLTPANGTPYFTHASVTKPGNNHPHGYDWESKPGSLTRTFHPRNALTNTQFGYGAVSNYYKPTGTYARDGGAGHAFESADDAVKAGLAVYENARLSNEANEKLSSLMNKIDPGFTSQFNRLYEAWKKTWETNAMYSDPAAYCKNREFEALAKFSQGDTRHAMLLVFDKFISGDHLITELLLLLTKAKYIHLLTEVKAERAAGPNDEQGRYKIHGDHDNGVLYIEKILKALKDEIVPEPISSDVTVTVSPNPVVDRLTIQINTTRSSKVSIVIVSAQTGMKQVVRSETVLPAGTYRFETSVKDMVRTNGDMLAVQVMVDGVVKTVKVMGMR